MSRNVLYVLIAAIVIILLFVLLGRRSTNNQGAFVSPTPVQASPTTEEISPSSAMSPEPSSTSVPSVNTPTNQVTVSPTQ